MTAEEELIESINGWFDDGDGRFFFSEEDKNRIVNALEKQVPKKLDDDCCPSCGKVEISSDMGYDYPFCPDCGQALDWEDEA